VPAAGGLLLVAGWGRPSRVVAGIGPLLAISGQVRGMDCMDPRRSLSLGPCRPGRHRIRGRARRRSRPRWPMWTIASSALCTAPRRASAWVIISSTVRSHSSAEASDRRVISGRSGTRPRHRGRPGRAPVLGREAGGRQREKHCLGSARERVTELHGDFDFPAAHDHHRGADRIPISPPGNRVTRAGAGSGLLPEPAATAVMRSRISCC
jgi:hypothetical protein